MDDPEIEARVAARRAKKKKKGAAGAGGDVGGDGARKKKKKKKKTPAGGGSDGSGDGKKKKKRRSRAEDDADAKDDARDLLAGCAAVGGRDAARKGKEDDFEAKMGAYGLGHDEEGDLELADRSSKDRAAAELKKSATRSDDRAAAEFEKSLLGDDMVFDADVDEAEESAYCFEADAEVMAGINQDGLVQVDEAGGIQAFIAETIAVDGDDVGIIRSDAEIDQEEKRRYSKYFCLAVAALFVVIVAMAVPLTLRYASGRRETRYTKVTAPPTEFPSQLPSAAPSGMPSSVRFTEIVWKLEPLSGAALWRRGSPQYLAAMWMADDDPIPNLKTGGTGLELDDARFEQRYVLVLFFFAMDGNNWISKQGWLGEESECEWMGIKGSTIGCEGGCIRRSDFVGDYDKVCRISMGRQNNLYGELPSELEQLSEMRWFEVQESFLVGSIPSSIGTAWTKLHTLLLGSNFLSGKFPETFQENTMLGTIFIDHNMFNGTFPNAVATMKNLEWFDAENNAFWGTLPDGIGNLNSLRIFNVNNNSLTGYLPDTWDENNLIEDLEVAYNNLKGYLPVSLGKAKFLKDFRASGNKFAGPLPVEYYAFEYLEELYLDDNLMEGELPQTAEPFYAGLQELSLHDNQFEGRFPVEHFEDTLRLKVLSLHRNELTGAISTAICDRKDASRAYTQLEVLSVDCDKMECSCCTCYLGGEYLDLDGER